MTKEKFEAYRKVQNSGKTNMFIVSAVCRLSKYVLDDEDCLEIMKNYAALEKEYAEPNLDQAEDDMDDNSDEVEEVETNVSE